jgi:hypothetical protein
MKNNSRKKKKIFEKFITDNEDFVKKLKDKDIEKNKQLKALMKSYKGFNTTDYSRISDVYYFYQNYKQYWEFFTIGEMEFLSIFFRKKEKNHQIFKKVADEYLKFLKNNKNENCLAYLKGIMSEHIDLEITDETTNLLKNLSSIAKGPSPDIMEIRKNVAALCLNLKVNDDFINYYNKTK